ncbi:hypothetical protein [Arvimicrobium flavum]|uniref:hypothetical protein n=1 Tax=Arvimicrobium flavum TaxID=3393320 RepID=UPI00237B0754|nr:hypothetical protein [Mesorhizobium shangrilense]
MNNDIPLELSEMREVLAAACRRLGIREGSLEHERMAYRILELFETSSDVTEVLAAALKGAER